MIQFIFPFTLALAGLMAGIHFANVLGYLPALREVEAEHILRFWKKADEYFGRRMPLFGSTLLISKVLTIFLLSKEINHISFWLMLFGFVLILADLVIAIKMNTPVNKFLRIWKGEAVPENFEAMRSQALAAFYGRAAAAILSFVITVIAYVLWHLKL